MEKDYIIDLELSSRHASAKINKLFKTSGCAKTRPRIDSKAETSMRGTFLFFLIGSAFSFKYRLSETTGKFDDATRISLTQFLNENTSGPDLPENGRFTSQSIAVLQEFLLENGRLPINDKWDSLAIGTLQNYLLKLGYYDMKPCGMFGTGTLKSFKRYLRDQVRLIQSPLQSSYLI